MKYFYDYCTPEPTPTPSVTPTPTVTPTEILNPTPTITPTVTPTPTITPTQNAIPVTPTVTPSITPTSSPIVGYYYKRFVDCNQNVCYMSLSMYEYNVNYNGLVLNVGDKYEYMDVIYEYVDDVVIYNNSPSCLLGNITKVTPYVLSYNGLYTYPDPIHPNGGTLVYIDECGVEQTISEIYLEETCLNVTVLSVLSHVGVNISCTPTYYGYRVNEYLAPYPSMSCTPNGTRIIANLTTTAIIGKFYRSNNLIDDCIFEVLEDGIDVSGGGYLITSIGGTGADNCTDLLPLAPI